jgi:hypothetical protein
VDERTTYLPEVPDHREALRQVLSVLAIIGLLGVGVFASAMSLDVRASHTLASETSAARLTAADRPTLSPSDPRTAGAATTSADRKRPAQAATESKPPPFTMRDFARTLMPSGRSEPPKGRPGASRPEPGEPAGSQEVTAWKHERIDLFTEEDLRRQLAAVPEVSLDFKTARALMAAVQQTTNRRPARTGEPFFLKHQPDLDQLPLLKGPDCHIGKDCAETLQVLSQQLRAILVAATTQDHGTARVDPDILRRMFFAEPVSGPVFQTGSQRAHWLTPEAIPTLLQLLQAENKGVRLVLVEALAKIPGPEASAALARRAVYDLSAEVREAALLALKDRPRAEARPVFLENLRHPWPPAAEHAAEALASLRDREAVPALVAELDKPDPRQPALSDLPEKKQAPAAQEVVRINHLKNCLMCHASSAAQEDLVRGRVPDWDRPLPVTGQGGYGSSPGLFVRADVTYLRQQFSVTQPVEAPGPWPTYQRFDYVVRTRPLTPAERAERVLQTGPSASPQHRAVLFAIGRLTGKDPEAVAAAWRTALASAGSR